MKHTFSCRRIFSGFVGLFLIAGGCTDFLEDPAATKDPNRAVTTDPDLLFNSVQIAQFFRQEGHLARTTAVWMQQLSGVDRQSLELGRYDFTEEEHDGEWNGTYTGGGLIDIRNIREATSQRGWRTYGGIVKVWEALTVGTTASLWGDIPYSEAVSDVATPRLDGQLQVYSAVQTLLDEAITDLNAGGGYIPPNDHVYDGDAAKWVQAANSLKARYYLHWAEVDAANYTNAITAALQGISSNANNFSTYHTDTESESNAWYQFWRERDSYIRGGKYLIDLLLARSDPRLPTYYDTADGGVYAGSDPGDAFQAASNLGAAMRARDLSTDILSYSETLLILAECYAKTGQDAPALLRLNDARRAQEAKWNLPANSLGIAVGLTGAALIDAIMEEKYISLFLNIEVYNDWKRTNRPALTPFTDRSIPRRLYYSDDERNANPNIPAPIPGLRNANDPGDSY